MTIAIFVGAYNPESGGAHTLIETIKGEILSAGATRHQFLFIVSGGRLGMSERIVDGIRFINIDRISSWRRGVLHRLAWRLKKSARRVLAFEEPAEPSVLDVLAAREGIDLYWFTGPFDLRTSVPYVYTVWDLGHRSVPWFPEVSRTGWSWESRERTYNVMIPRASYLITGNAEGKKEILDNYRVAPNRIRILPFPIPQFCGSELQEEWTRHESLPERYVFYPAQFWPHKNHITILLALKRLQERGIGDISAIFTGSDKGNRKYIEQKILELGLDNHVKILGFVSESELKYLYRQAFCLVFASLMGPNNLPPLEAAALGCPVLLSDLEGHKEQMGEAAFYFTRSDEEDLAGKIETLIKSPELRQEIITRGMDFSARHARYSYFGEMCKIIEEYSLARRCWGRG